jgi:hypothetical protein
MLKLPFHTQLQLGFAQAAVAAVAAFVVVLLAPRRNIHLEGETLAAMIRGIVQIIAVERNFAFAAEWAALDQHLTSGRHDRRRGGYFGAPRQGNTGRIASLFLGNRIRRGIHHRNYDLAWRHRYCNYFVSPCRQHADCERYEHQRIGAEPLPL